MIEWHAYAYGSHSYLMPHPQDSADSVAAATTSTRNKVIFGIEVFTDLNFVFLAARRIF